TYVRERRRPHGLSARGFTLRLGGGIALPVADIHNRGDTLAVLGAFGMRGAWSPWLWAPDRFSVFGVAQLDGHPSRWFVWAVDGGVGLMFDTGDDAEDTGFVLQGAVEIGVVPSPAWTLGARFQVVWMLVDNSPPIGDEFAQTALEPFVRWQGRHGFIRGGL